MKVLMTGQSIRVILAASAAVWAVGCGKKSSSPEPAISPVAVAPVGAAPGAQQAPITRAAPTQAPAAGPTDQQQAAAPKVTITNKDDASVATPSGIVTLSFSMSGLGAGQSQSDYVLQCKSGADATFSTCSVAGAYTFTDLKDKTQYTLTVQALNKTTNAVVASDTVTFTAIRSQAGNGEGASGEDGSNGVGGGGGGGGNVVAVAPLIPQNFLIGQRLMFSVPTDSHVTEYVSTLNYNNSYVAYQIDASSDPTYIGNNSCTWNAQRGIVSTDAAGNQYKYCQTAPGSMDGYGGLPHNWAPNHIETSRNVLIPGKDGKLVQVAPELEFHADINVFDSKMPFNRSHSAFWNLCSNKLITVVKSVWVMQDFFGRPVSADVAVCKANLSTAISLGQLPNGTYNQFEFFVAAYTVNYSDSTSIAAVTPGTCWTDGHPEACESLTFLGDIYYKALIEVTLVAKVGTTGKNELDFVRDAMAFTGAGLHVLH